MRFGGGRTVAVAIVVLAMAGQLVQGAVPSSRVTGYSASVDLTRPEGSQGRGVAVLETGWFKVWLEGDDRNKCSLSVREKYTGRFPSVVDRGYLLWSANYYSHTPAGAENCTLRFTARGELQLWILNRGAASLTWSSHTAGQGATRMALDDRGNFQLLTPCNKAVFQSFNVKEWLVLDGQKFWAGELLKSPDQVYNDTDSRVLANAGTFIMAIRGGDLQLLINGNEPKVYWSLKKETPSFTGDLSKVRYAALVMDNEQGIGLYTASGSLVYRIAVLSLAPKYGADFHFGLDFYGNLKYSFMYKGANWMAGWQVFDEPCDLPSFCGQYGECTSLCGRYGQCDASVDMFSYPNVNCTCPEGFKPAGVEVSAGCVRRTSVNKCNHTNYLQLAGSDTASIRYMTPTTKSVQDCLASCSQDCKCDGVLFNVKSQHCFKVTQFLTIKKTTYNTGTSAYIKVK